MENDIKIIHPFPRHPTTNRCVDRLHREIKKPLLALKLQIRIRYNIEFSLSNATRAQNDTIQDATKYVPIEAFLIIQKKKI